MQTVKMQSNRFKKTIFYPDQDISHQFKESDAFFNVNAITKSIYQGVPVIKIYLAGCDIGSKSNCPFCISDFRLNTAKRIELKNILYITDDHKNMPVVITGGEPFLNSNLPKLLSSLKNRKIVETNGHYKIPELLGADYIISPKPINNKWNFTHIKNNNNGYITIRWMVTIDSDSPFSKHIPIELINIIERKKLVLELSPIIEYSSLAKHPNQRARGVWNTSVKKLTEYNFEAAMDYALFLKERNINVTLHTPSEILYKEIPCLF